MCEFKHSEVLFTGDDGLPLEFNVRNVIEKSLLKALIEHGAGLCTQDVGAIHLITPNTKVLNASLGKKLVSTRYIFDCVEENCLLNVNDYVHIVTEADTSDISDEDSLILHPRTKKSDMKETVLEESINIEPEMTESADKTEEQVDTSTKSISFVEGSPQVPRPGLFRECRSSFPVNGLGEKDNSLPASSEILSENLSSDVYFTSTAKEGVSGERAPHRAAELEKSVSPIRDSLSLISPAKSNNLSNIIPPSQVPPLVMDVAKTVPNAQTVVSSSQAGMDQFDNLLLEKAQTQREEDVESLSQSYTVSSSADAQISPKPNSTDVDSADLFGNRVLSVVPDSPGKDEDTAADVSEYLRRLEEEVETILLKPSPKSIQDKITLVKYVCCVKKLSPAIVLQSLDYL